MKVRVLSIGKDRSKLFQPAVDEYAARLGHYTRFELLELKAEASMEAEADVLLGKLGAQEWLVAMDERGKLLDSVELARFVEKARLAAKDVCFVVGGDEGLSPRVRERAQLTLSLSKMTLPHRLARVVLVEQLYRAFTILKGEPYHK